MALVSIRNSIGCCLVLCEKHPDKCKKTCFLMSTEGTKALVSKNIQAIVVWCFVINIMTKVRKEKFNSPICFCLILIYVSEKTSAGEQAAIPEPRPFCYSSIRRTIAAILTLTESTKALISTIDVYISLCCSLLSKYNLYI